MSDLFDDAMRELKAAGMPHDLLRRASENLETARQNPFRGPVGTEPVIDPEPASEQTIRISLPLKARWRVLLGHPIEIRLSTYPDGHVAAKASVPKKLRL